METHGTWQWMSTNSKKSRKNAFCSSAEAWVMPAPSSKKPEEREFLIDSGASMRKLSKKDPSSGEVETLRRSRNPITVVTATGEVQTNEEAQVYVHYLHLFVTLQLLEDTPAVLSLGKLCEEHRYSIEWASGEKPRLIHGIQKVLQQFQEFGNTEGYTKRPESEMIREPQYSSILVPRFQMEVDC